MIRGLYVHIPFCKSKCPYCDFTSFVGRNGLMKEYINAVLKEAEEFAGEEVCTIYFGGGTPSIMSAEETEMLLLGLCKNFRIADGAEITIEANPKTLGSEKLEAYRNIGINRLSIGVQSFDDGILKRLGRLHTGEDAKNVVSEAKRAGFENISIDLMFSVPGQTAEIVKNDARTAVSLDVTHISCYGLKIEPGTQFYKKGVKCLDDETDREMFDTIKNILEASGYSRYEISNFAKNGFKSQHNLLYWNCSEYIGLGCGAHSYVNGKRYSDTTDIEQYIKEVKRENECVLSERDKLVEKLIMGMRLTDGVEADVVKRLGSEKILDKYIKEGFIALENKKIKFTDKGFDVSNYILSELI